MLPHHRLSPIFGYYVRYRRLGRCPRQQKDRVLWLFSLSLSCRTIDRIGELGGCLRLLRAELVVLARLVVLAEIVSPGIL